MNEGSSETNWDLVLREELDEAQNTADELHAFLAVRIDLLLEEGLAAAGMWDDSLPALTSQPSWGSVSAVARAKSAMQPAR